MSILNSRSRFNADPKTEATYTQLDTKLKPADIVQKIQSGQTWKASDFFSISKSPIEIPEDQGDAA